MPDVKPEDRPVLDERYHAALIAHAMQHGWQTAGCRSFLLGSQVAGDQQND